MLDRPSQKPHKDLSKKPTAEPTHRKPPQNGLPVPSENLTHITAYLDPPTLFILSRVNRLFYDHVKDDHTWYRAFLLNFLGISPEGDLDDEKTLLLRRSELTWRREYVLRFNLLRRWENSRNTTIAHAPVHSPISDIQLMPGNAVLCSFIQYGIVSRSIVFTGRVIRGFLSPSPSGTGLGIGNPNTEFAPNVSACALTSEGGTAKIAWGFRSGGVAIMTAARTMETSSRSAAKLVACSVGDGHDGEVVYIAWNETGSHIISAAKDGRIKVWEAKKIQCVWSSEYLVPDVCTRAEFSIQHGCVVAAMRSGDILLWTGLDWTTPSNMDSRGTRITCPDDAQSQDEDHILPVITSLHLDPTDSILVSYQSICRFYRIFFRDSNEIIVTRLYDSTFVGAVSITRLLPCYPSPKSAEIGFVFAGDSMGCVSVYPYTSEPVDIVSPIRKFEAHEDGAAVTALSWNGLTLVSGSANGSASVFDAITLKQLRVLDTQLPRPRGNLPDVSRFEGVKQIILGPEKDVLLFSVGSHVIGYKADLASRDKKHKNPVLGKKKAKAIILNKGYDQHVLKKLVSESIAELKQDNDRRRLEYGRQREQVTNLEELGLDESEAVEYVLMLSRDEAQQRERERLQSIAIEEGVFEGDFDDIASASQGPEIDAGFTASSGSSNAQDTDSLPSISPSVSCSPSLSSSPQPGRSSPMSISMSMFSAGTPKSPGGGISHSRRSPRGSPSASIQKIQVSPRSARAEPMEAEFGEGSRSGQIRPSYISSSLSSSLEELRLGDTPDVDNDAAIASSLAEESGATEHFPPIHRKGVDQPTENKGKASSRPSAWSKPLRDINKPVSRYEIPLPRRPKKASSTNPTILSSMPSGSSKHTQSGRSGTVQHEDEEDEDLKLAIMLSLEDARKRGELV